MMAGKLGQVLAKDFRGMIPFKPHNNPMRFGYCPGLTEAEGQSSSCEGFDQHLDRKPGL